MSNNESKELIDLTNKIEFMILDLQFTKIFKLYYIFLQK